MRSVITTLLNFWTFSRVFWYLWYHWCLLDTFRIRFIFYQLLIKFVYNLSENCQNMRRKIKILNNNWTINKFAKYIIVPTLKFIFFWKLFYFCYYYYYGCLVSLLFIYNNILVILFMSSIIINYFFKWFIHWVFFSKVMRYYFTKLT